MLKESLLFFKNINPYIDKCIYLQGIPNLNDNFKLKIQPTKDGILFLDVISGKEKFHLLKNKIQNITIADRSTMGNRIGLKRLLLVGVFALAWKKKETTPLAILIFEYQDDFGSMQEMYIQSDAVGGYQFFTNVKYNLQKFWKAVEDTPNADAVIKQLEEGHLLEQKKKNKSQAIGCLIFLVVIVVIFLVAKNK